MYRVRVWLLQSYDQGEKNNTYFLNLVPQYKAGQVDLTDTITLKVSFPPPPPRMYSQDHLGVLVSRDLGVSSTGTLQCCWSAGLLLLQHDGGDFVVRARGQAQQLCLE